MTDAFIPDPDIRDEREARRYALDVEGQTVVVLYNEAAGGLLITETLTPPSLEGRGLASRMARHVLGDIRSRGLMVLPTCPFFAHYLGKHREWSDIVHPAYRAALGL